MPALLTSASRRPCCSTILGDERVPGVLVGHVEMVVAGGVADSRSDLRAVVVEHIGDHHLRAFGRKELGLGGALAARIRP